MGAGVAGLSAAYALRDAPSCIVTLFEKSRGYGGRAATRRKNGTYYDHGANYFQTDDAPRIHRLVREALPSEDLVDVARPVWTFDATGRISEGDPERNQTPKWTYRRGISQLGKLLAEAAGAEVHLQTCIGHLEKERGGWTLADTEGARHGLFDAVLLTPPAPQTRDLVAASRMENALQRRLAEALGAVAYRTQLTLILAYSRRIERPGPFYALLNTDRQHAIAWLGFEEDKPGHVPEGQSLLVAQMAPAWSEPRFRHDLGALWPEAAEEVSTLLGQDLRQPAWADKQGWRYALPEEAADAGTLAEGQAAGLFFAGDALVGKGRVERALQTGLNAGKALQRFVGEQA